MFNYWCQSFLVHNDTNYSVNLASTLVSHVLFQFRHQNTGITSIIVEEICCSLFGGTSDMMVAPPTRDANGYENF